MQGASSRSMRRGRPKADRSTNTDRDRENISLHGQFHNDIADLDHKIINSEQHNQRGIQIFSLSRISTIQHCLLSSILSSSVSEIFVEMTFFRITAKDFLFLSRETDTRNQDFLAPALYPCAIVAEPTAYNGRYTLTSSYPPLCVCHR